MKISTKILFFSLVIILSFLSAFTLCIVNNANPQKLIADIETFNVSGIIVDQLGNAVPDLDITHYHQTNVIGAGETNLAGAFSFESEKPDGLEEIYGEDFDMLKIIGANPFGYNGTRLEASMPEDGTLSVSDLNGRPLLEQKLEGHKIHTISWGGNALPKGIYIISVQDNDGNYSAEKIIVQNSNGQGLSIVDSRYLQPQNHKLAEIINDSLTIEGINFTNDYHLFEHEFEDIDVGQIMGNVGPSETQELGTQEVEMSNILKIPLTDYFYNDDQTEYMSSHPDVKIVGDTIIFNAPPFLDTYNTTITARDLTDLNLFTTSNLQINVVEEVEENEAPEIDPDIPDVVMQQGGSNSALDLDNHWTDDLTSAENANWTFEGGENINITIDENHVPHFTSPNPDYSGIETIIFKGTDEGDKFDTDTMTVTVVPETETGMVAVDDFASTPYETPVIIDVAGNDIPINSTIDYSSVTTEGVLQPLLGTFIGINPTTGAITFDPFEGESGEDNFEYIIKNDLGDPDTANVSVTIGAQGNDAPIEISPILEQFTNEGYTLKIPLLNHAHDPNSDELSIEDIANLGSDGEYTFENDTIYFSTPNQDYFGTISDITITVTDGIENLVMTPFDWNIANVNDAPYLVSDIPNLSELEDNVLVYDMNPHFSDIENDELSFYMIGLPSDWEQSWDDGVVSITTTDDWNGIVEDIYVEASDYQYTTPSNNFDITFDPDNDAPFQTNPIGNWTILENTYLDIEWYQNNADDIDNPLEDLTASLDNLINATYEELDDSTIRITPTPGYVGTISGIVMNVEDLEYSTSLDSFDLTVTDSNEAPEETTPIPEQFTNEGDTLRIAIYDYVNDPDGDDVNVIGVANLGSDGDYFFANDTLDLYTTDVDWYGTINDITITVSDGIEDLVMTPFDWNIANVNDPPVFSGNIGPLSSTEDNAIVYDLSVHFSDIDNETLTYDLTGIPSSYYSIAGSVATIIHPDQDWNGIMENIKATANDGEYTAESNEFDATFTAVNDTPTFSGTIPLQTSLEDNSIVIDASTYFNDVDSGLSFVVNDLVNAIYSVNGNDITITPNDDWNGTIEDISITGSDGEYQVTSNLFDYQVSAVNDAPFEVTPIITQTINEDGQWIYTVRPANVDDVDSPTLSYTLDNVVNATWSTDGDEITITPNDDYYGTIAGIVIKANDGEYITSMSAFDLVVNPVNDAPEFNGTIANQIGTEDNAITLDLSVYFLDLENDPLTYDLEGIPSSYYSIDGSIATILHPDEDWNGTMEDLKATANDGEYTAESNLFDAIFTAVNDAPEFNGTIDDLLGTEDNAIVIDLSSYFSDVENDDLTYDLTGIPSTYYSIAGSVATIIHPDQDWNGTMENIKATANDGEYTAESNEFDATFTAVNDAPTFSGTIPDFVINDDETITINGNQYFSDVDTETLAYALLNLSNGTYEIIQDSLMVITPNPGSSFEDDLQVSGNDGNSTAYSNIFSMDVNETTTEVPVTFYFKDAAQDTLFSSGTSTLYYKKAGWTQDSVLTSTDGEVTINMIVGASYDIQGAHDDDLEALYSIDPFYTAIKRPSDVSAFAQSANNDYELSMIVASGEDSILLYKLHNNFPLGDMIDYASKLNGSSEGIRRFGDSNTSIPFWVDTSNGGQGLTPTQEEWYDDFVDDWATLPHANQWSYVFEEDATQPSGPHMRVNIDSDNPTPANVTYFNATTHEITQANAIFPLSFSEVDFKQEEIEAKGDLNDIGGSSPQVLNNSSQNYTLNTTGRNIFSVMYLFKPGTEF